MRILVIAYEFPPSPTPSALRWAHLSDELARRGHEVHVLAPSLPAAAIDAFAEPDHVKIHRTFAGPLCSVSGAGRRSSSRIQRSSSERSRPGPPPGLNWKGRAHEALKDAAGLVLFPDVRGEWRPWAWRALRSLLPDVSPDVVISAHEPAVTLDLGRAVARMGYCWVADLGDPVLTPYTPRRWRRRSLALERGTCRDARGVVVTTERAGRLLADRHGIDPARLQVISQGFNDRPRVPDVAGRGARGPDTARREGPLELFYSGRFYDFRRPDALFTAVASCADVRLSIAAATVPARLMPVIAAAPGRFNMLGARPHGEVLRLQSDADVLVNIGNDGMSAQIPGKLFEYLGSGRPILHLKAAVDDGDPALAVIGVLGAGWVCENMPGAVSGLLATLVSAKHRGELEAWKGPPTEVVAQFGWQRLAARYEDFLASLLSRGTRAPDPRPGAV